MDEIYAWMKEHAYTLDWQQKGNCFALKPAPQPTSVAELLDQLSELIEERGYVYPD